MSQLNDLITDFKNFKKTSITKHYPKEPKERTVNLLNRQSGLHLFLDNEFIPIDNNMAERRRR